MKKHIRAALAALALACLAAVAAPVHRAEAATGNFFADLIAIASGKDDPAAQDDGVNWNLVAGIILAVAAVPIAVHQRRHPDKSVKFMFRKMF
ncbi:MAG: hypothetical protein AB7E47_16135 [Desulfovibrionaceae bacterium]